MTGDFFHWMMVSFLSCKNAYDCQILFQSKFIGPYNASGIWKGVMGDVIMGKYQMSLNSWIWTLERQPILDFVPVTKDNPLLCLIPKPPEVDPGLFIRPFTGNLSV